MMDEFTRRGRSFEEKSVCAPGKKRRRRVEKFLDEKSHQFSFDEKKTTNNNNC